MHHGSGCIGPPNTSMWAQAFAFAGRLPSDMVIRLRPNCPSVFKRDSLLDGLARSSKVDQDGHGPPHSILRQSAAVLDVVKTRPGNGGACLDVEATAGLDDICARRRGLSTVGAEEFLAR